jgi:hypothetical protein
MSVVSLFIALGNPSMLLPLALVVCSVIYIITSFIFVYNAIIKATKCKASLKDWIKVNGYVALFFGTMCIIQFITLKMQPQMMQTFINQSMSMQKNMPKDAVTLMMPKIIDGVLYFILTFGVFLVSHISITFAFLRTKEDLFKQD